METLPPFTTGDVTHVPTKPVLVVYQSGDPIEFRALQTAKAYLASKRGVGEPGAHLAKIYQLQDEEWVEVEI
jgi:hypothetical protein